MFIWIMKTIKKTFIQEFFQDKRSPPLLKTKICYVYGTISKIGGYGTWTCIPKKQTSTPSCSSKANIALALYGKLSNISPVSTYLKHTE